MDIATPIALWIVGGALSIAVALFGYCNLLEWISLCIYQHSKTLRRMQESSRAGVEKEWEYELGTSPRPQPRKPEPVKLNLFGSKKGKRKSNANAKRIKSV